jgi:UDP-N-acetylglucosamine--N-acetylmuramyl-(pentapeptide) pyrophosphoryl-undecaprenol N-acetylglucosamine transferase
MDVFDGKRIYFGACGMGLGHVSRSLPIAQEVVKRGGDVLISTYLESVHYVHNYGLPVVAAPDLSMEVDVTGSIDIKATTLLSGIGSTLTFLDQVRFEIQTMQAFEPDLIFSDTRLSTIYAARLLKIPVVLLLNQFLPRVPREKDTIFFRLLDGTILTTLGRSWALSNVILIPDFSEPYTISLDSLRIPRRIGARVTLVGSILQQTPGNNSRVKEIRESLGVGEDQKLIYAGISGPLAERTPLINILIPILSRFPERFKVIMSMGNPNGGSKVNRRGNLTLVPWIENRFDYLEACDAVISRGGHETLIQSIIYGKPSVIIPVPKHPEQYGNARRAMELNVARVLHQRDLTLSHLVQRIDEVLESNETQKVLKDIKAKEHLGDGLNRTIEALAEFLD